MTPSTHRQERRLIDAHFHGRASLAGERAMREHLVVCAGCRDHYERHVQLEASDPWTAVGPRARIGRGLGLVRVTERATARRPLAALVSVAAACAALVLLVFGGRSPGPDLVPRGGPSTPGSQLLVYEIADGGQTIPVVSEVRAGRGLAFAYVNVGHKRHLLVFGVDDAGRVYWYHPVWNDSAEAPVGVEIAQDEAVHEIKEAIYHRPSGKTLALFGVFTDRPLSTRDVEAAVARAPRDDRGRLTPAFEGADVNRLDLHVGSEP